MAACAPGPAGTDPAPQASPATPRAEAPAAASLNDLGEAALDVGDLPVAERRFSRALAADPESRRARVGLARIALRRQQPEEAARLAEQALLRDRSDYDAMVLLGVALAAKGDEAAAGAALLEARALAPARPEAHAALARLTGPAPREPAADADEALRRAAAHPYDPVAGLAAARALLDAGEREQAVRHLRGTFWLGDLGPEAALEAALLLKEVEPSWRERRLVLVHSFADEGLRQDPWWRMRLRLLWLGVSRSLHPLLQTVFIPVSMGEFATNGVGDRLSTIRAAFARAVPQAPRNGLIAAFTGRPMPRRSGEWRLGEAQFLGRKLLVRLPRGPSTESRTLIHEVLHLYGAVHVSPDFPSLMNPTGESLDLDPANTRIAYLQRDRLFDGAGIERDVLARADLAALSDAYKQALGQNLMARKAGMSEAVDALPSSRSLAREKAVEAGALDSHLADVAGFVATLHRLQGEPASAARLFEIAARLYGYDTARGRAARAQAVALVPPE